MGSAIQIFSKEHVVSQDIGPGEYRPCCHKITKKPSKKK